MFGYGLFFLYPIFFNEELMMQFPHYLPGKPLIGVDLRQMLSYSHSWFVEKQTPYIGENLYPPFATFFFTTLIFLPFRTAYILTSFGTLFAFALTTFIIPFQILKDQLEALQIVFLIFVMGLFSYGLHFEIERGQFNLIAFSFACAAIFLFHKKPKNRILAYILISLSIQLKVYPAIFVFLLVDDWIDWRRNFRRFIILGLVNIAFLFMLGWNYFVDFVNAIQRQMRTPGIWIGNHSAKSFVTILVEKISQRNLSGYFWWIEEYSNVLESVLVGIIILGFLIMILCYYRKGAKGFQPEVFLVSVTTALMLPSVSHDYTLPLLSAPVLLYVGKCFCIEEEKGIFSKALISLLFFFYISTLFSYTNKTILLQNNFPAIFMIFLIVVFLEMVSQMAKYSNDSKNSACRD